MKIQQCSMPGLQLQPLNQAIKQQLGLLSFKLSRCKDFDLISECMLKLLTVQTFKIKSEIQKTSGMPGLALQPQILSSINHLRSQLWLLLSKSFKEIKDLKTRQNQILQIFLLKNLPSLKSTQPTSPRQCKCLRKDHSGGMIIIKATREATSNLRFNALIVKSIGILPGNAN